MALRRPMPSSIGMLWTETMPKQGDTTNTDRTAPRRAPRHHVAEGVAPPDAVQHRDVVDRDDAEAGGNPDPRQELRHQVADVVAALRHGPRSSIATDVPAPARCVRPTVAPGGPSGGAAGRRRSAGPPRAARPPRTAS